MSKKLQTQFLIAQSISAGNQIAGQTFINTIFEKIYIQYVTVSFGEVYQTGALPSNEVNSVVLSLRKNNVNINSSIPGLTAPISLGDYVYYFYKNNFGFAPIYQNYQPGDAFRFSFNFHLSAPATANITATLTLSLVYELVE